jgi:hypothetical protein
MQDRPMDMIEKIVPLIGTLQPDECYQLWKAVSSGQIGDSERVQYLRRLLAQQLNGPRKDHAQRLFLNLWEPLLVRDPYLLLAGRRMPGMLHIADLGAFWFALREMEFKEFIFRAQSWLEKQAQDMPIDEVMLADTARSLQRTLREEAIGLVEGLLAHDAVNRQRFLDLANATRVQIIALQIGACDLAPLREEDLRAFLVALFYAERLNQLTEGIDIKAPARTLAAKLISMAKGQEEGRPSPYDIRPALWPLLNIIHEHRRYDLAREAQSQLMKGGLPKVNGATAQDDSAMLVQALWLHRQAWIKSLYAALMEIAGEVHAAGHRSLQFSPTSRQRIESWLTLLEQLRQLLDTVPPPQEADEKSFNRVLNTLITGTLPHLVDGYRLRFDRLEATPEELTDFNDALWFGQILRSFKILAQLYHIDLVELDGALVRFAQLLKRCYMSIETQREQSLYFERAARLALAVDAFTHRLPEWFSLSNRRLVTRAQGVLAQPGEASEIARQAALLLLQQARRDVSLRS